MTLPAYAMQQSSFPELYERWLVDPLFRPWAEVLLERVRLAPGDRVLDIACGTGIVARLAKDRLGTSANVVGVDLSPQMLGVARTIAPGIDWREGNAASLPVAAAETFDVVVCQQGLQFVADKPAAAREMRRVLVPGGRLAVATWRPADEIPIVNQLQQIAERHVGTIVDARHGFGETAALEALLAGAGFHDIGVETLSGTTRIADGTVFLRLNTMALVGMSARSKSMTDDERAAAVNAIVNDSADVLGRFNTGPELAFEISTNVAIARG